MFFLRKLSPKSKIENYFFLLIFISSFGDLLYRNDLYIPAEMLRLPCAVLFSIILIVHFTRINKTHNVLYSLLILWMFFVTFLMCIASGKSNVIDTSLKGTIANIFLSPQVLPSMFPLAVLIIPRYRLVDFNYFIKICMVATCAYLLFYPFAFYNMVTYEWDVNTRFEEEGSYYNFVNLSTLGIRYICPPIIMLFWKRYLSPMKWKLIVIALIGDLLMSLFLARRGQSFMSILTFFSFFVLTFSCTTSKTKVRMIWIMIMILVVISFLFLKYADGFLGTILERGFEDTRSSVTEGFHRDVNGLDALIGRGWLGTYYERHFNDPTRREIETGYLALILRGGWIYMILYVSVLLISAFKGLLHSNSFFVKSFAVIILLHIVELYPHGWPRFNLSYLSIWIGVYVCLFKPYCKLTDNDYLALLSKNK